MPNHIMNRITFSGKKEDVSQILEFIKGENGDIDFDKIEPMPQTYKDYDTTNYPYGAYIKDENKKAEFLKASELQQKKYGVVGWYDWRILNWGTKWNAYQISSYRNIIFFQTAWSGVPNLIRTLALRFPKVEIEYAYADEDYGYNVGVGFSKEGIFKFKTLEDNSNDAIEVYLDLWGNEDEFEKINGVWIRKEY